MSKIQTGKAIFLFNYLEMIIFIFQKFKIELDTIIFC